MIARGRTQALAKVTAQYPKAGSSQIASLYAVRKQPDEMFHWLDVAYEVRDGGLTQIMIVPFIMHYRDDPRFIALCDKLKIVRPPPGSDPFRSFKLS